MTPAERAKHALQDDWQDAYVEEKIRDLVQALNRESLGIYTIAACEGHVRGLGSPYVLFRSPVDVAELIDQTLTDARSEFNYAWILQGMFNAKRELCFSIRSPYLQRAKLWPWPPLWAYWIYRKKIDDDLCLLARIIGESLNNFGEGLEVCLPQKKGENCQNQEKGQAHISSLSLSGLPKRVFMRAVWARLIRLSLIGKWVATFLAFKQHALTPNKRGNRYPSPNSTPLLVVSLFLVTGLDLGAFAQEPGTRVATVRSVYDGDTFRADIAGPSPMAGRNVSIRVTDIDTPEIKGRCPYEIQLALKARDLTASLLKAATTVELRNLRRGYYGRIVAEVWIDGVSLGAILLDRGLARQYNSWSRQKWC